MVCCKKQNIQNVNNDILRTDYLSCCKGSSFKDDREHFNEKLSISERETANITYKGTPISAQNPQKILFKSFLRSLSGNPGTSPL